MTWLLFLLTDEVSCDPAEVTLRNLPELIIAVSLLADHKFAVLAGVKPFRVHSNARHGAATVAIEANPRPQLDKWSALRQFGGFFIFDANPGSAQTVLLCGDRTDHNLIAAGSSADRAPVSRSQSGESHKQDWS